jgi:hypothetical protein
MEIGRAIQRIEPRKVKCPNSTFFCNKLIFFTPHSAVQTVLEDARNLWESVWGTHYPCVVRKIEGADYCFYKSELLCWLFNYDVLEDYLLVREEYVSANEHINSMKPSSKVRALRLVLTGQPGIGMCLPIFSI